MSLATLYLKLAPKLNQTTIVRGPVSVSPPPPPPPPPPTTASTSVVATVIATSPFSVNYANSGGPGDTLKPRFIFPGGLTVDGYVLQVGDTVLINFNTAIYSGLYICTVDGISDGRWVLTRDSRMITAAQIQNTIVTAGGTGTSLKFTMWLCSNVGNVTVGTTPIAFRQLNSSGTGNDLNYVYNQAVAASTWTITHNLNKYPSVSIVDSANDNVFGNVVYDSANSLTINFSAAFAGTAYLN